MNRKKMIRTLAITVIAAMLGVNILHSLDGYGIGKISLHPAIWAQTGGTGNGNGSGNGSGSGGGTNTGTGGGSDSGTYDIAGDANNASGWLWEDYSYNCIIAKKVVVLSACASFYVGATYYSNLEQIMSQITECGGSYSIAESESGIKKYCFDGWSFCLSNYNCH